MTALTAKAHLSFAFGPFVLIPDRGLLLENGRQVRIGGRALEVLTVLLERQGEVVSKRDLMDRAWPDVVVDDSNLKVTMASLRRSLGDAAPGRYIATVVGRGYRFVADVQTSAPYAMPASTSARHNLPATTPRVFGRAETIDAMLADLDDARLLTIVGPGGVGKTTVALEIAARLTGAFEAGVWLVDLSDVQDPSLICATVAKAAGLQADTPMALCDGLRLSAMLLVLDNCEHLIDEIAACADLILQNTRFVTLLATSREPLCIKGERVRRLPGLAGPQPGPVSPEDALTYPAIQLFADRAQACCASFRLDDTNAETAAEICRRLDGIALAIKRVASRVETISVAGLLDHLDCRFHMFDVHHCGPERHRTLTANVEASYALLSQVERAILHVLSALSNPFTLNEACEIGERNRFGTAEMVEGVANLAVKSMLTAETRGGEMVYRLPLITHAFVLERTQDTTGGQQEVRQEPAPEHAPYDGILRRRPE